MIGLWLAAGASYLVGSMPTAYVAIRALKGIDIRTVGSGNVGATNVSRVAGGKVGLAVFLIDCAKGVIAVRCVAPWLAGTQESAVLLGCGVLAVVGHIAPCWLKFRGGKGVATTIGVLVAYDPRLAGVCALVWGACYAGWRYVSVASIAAMVMMPLVQWLLRKPGGELGLGVALALLVIWKHRANIARLRAGTEPRTRGVGDSSRKSKGP